MRTNHHSNALLVELLIVVLFFMLASTVLIRLFGAAWDQSRKAEQKAEAVAELQNVADMLYARQDMKSALEEMGFTGEGVQWTRDDGRMNVTVVTDEQKNSFGVLQNHEITARDEYGQVLYSLSASCFREVSP